MNPPYAQPLLSRFVEKLIVSEVIEACVLVNNATETKWFQLLASHAAAICFPKGRIRFWSTSKQQSKPLQGQAVLYIGQNTDEFTKQFSKFGLVMRQESANMKSPLKWVGGKSKMVKTLLPMIPEHKCYVEVFGGAGWFGLQHYDKVYQAKVFTEEYSNDNTYSVCADEYIVGVTGYSLKSKLPTEIGHVMPDYSLYKITKTAYGFLTRGCPRKCGFCIVSEKEGNTSVRVASVSEWWNSQPEIELLDPNLLACKEHMEIITELATTWVNNKWIWRSCANFEDYKAGKGAGK